MRINNTAWNSGGTSFLHRDVLPHCHTARVVEDSSLGASSSRAQGPSGPSPSGATAPNGAGSGPAVGEGGVGELLPSSSWSAVPVDWVSVVEKARERGERDCPICIGSLARRGKMGEL